MPTEWLALVHVPQRHWKPFTSVCSELLCGSPGPPIQWASQVFLQKKTVRTWWQFTSRIHESSPPDTYSCLYATTIQRCTVGRPAVVTCIFEPYTGDFNARARCELRLPLQFLAHRSSTCTSPGDKPWPMSADVLKQNTLIPRDSVSLQNCVDQNRDETDSRHVQLNSILT